jgi:transposase-like protein
MDAELERFRQEVARLQEGKVRSSVRYPEALRAFAVRYVAEAQGRGESQASAAARLGISEPTLGAWRRGSPWRRRSGAAAPPGAGERLVPVAVREEPAGAAAADVAHTSGVAVVAPTGWRVEGLSAREAAALLKELGC